MDVEGSLQLGESRVAVAWSPCGRWLASGGRDKMVYVYDAQTFEVKWPLKADSMSLCFSPSGDIVAACSDGKASRMAREGQSLTRGA